MNIAWDISIQATPHVTGVERVQRSLLRELCRMDGENRYFLITRRPVRLDFELPENFQVVDLAARRPTYLWREQLMPAVIERERVQVLHSPVSAIPILGKCRKIATVHELPWVERHKGPVTVRKGHKVWLFLNTRFADRIVAVSHRTRRNILKLYPESAEKIVVIHHGVDERFKPLEILPAPEEFLGRFSIPAGPFVFFVGSLRRKKNMALLLDAFERLLRRGTEVNLVLAGIRNTAWPDLEERTAGPPLAGRVFFPGYVSDRDLVYFYNLAELVVYPSMFEGFGLPPLEAMACGTPVVTTTGGSIPEVVGDAAITLEPTDREGLCEAMARILEDPLLGAEYVRRGFERLKRFTWKKAAQAFLDLYRELAQ